MKKVNFEILKGLVINKIDLPKKNRPCNDPCMIFDTNDGIFIFQSKGECCAHIYLEDFIGDIEDVVNSPVLQAEKIESPLLDSCDPLKEYVDDPSNDTNIWCFYKLVTIKGYVTLRFMEHNNGFYSTSLDFKKRYKKKL